jgi:hypothetical protein
MVSVARPGRSSSHILQGSWTAGRFGQSGFAVQAVPLQSPRRQLQEQRPAEESGPVRTGSKTGRNNGRGHHGQDPPPTTRHQMQGLEGIVNARIFLEIAQGERTQLYWLEPLPTHPNVATKAWRLWKPGCKAFYDVSIEQGVVNCTCADANWRQRSCKHARATMELGLLGRGR